MGAVEVKSSFSLMTRLPAPRCHAAVGCKALVPESTNDCRFRTSSVGFEAPESPVIVKLGRQSW
jgi:hypothetical protein